MDKLDDKSPKKQFSMLNKQLTLLSPSKEEPIFEVQSGMEESAQLRSSELIDLELMRDNSQVNS